MNRIITSALAIEFMLAMIFAFGVAWAVLLVVEWVK